VWHFAPLLQLHRSPGWIAWWMRDFRFAFRSLAGDKRFALVAIFTLSLGIGATTTVFSVVYNLLPIHSRTKMPAAWLSVRFTT
jgi:hypothetical protein